MIMPLNKEFSVIYKGCAQAQFLYYMSNNKAIDKDLTFEMLLVIFLLSKLVKHF